MRAGSTRRVLVAAAVGALVVTGCAANDETDEPGELDEPQATATGDDTLGDGEDVAGAVGDADADPVDDGDDPDEGEEAGDEAGDAGASDAEPTIFRIAQDPPTPRAELAPGVVLAEHLLTDGEGWYVILSAAPDGTVVENWRFELVPPSGLSDTAYAPGSPRERSFNSDMTKLAGTAQHRLEPSGLQSHVGYFERDGTFVDLSGREPGVRSVEQTEPVFGPDDRLYYWESTEGSFSEFRLRSVSVDGGDHRDEADAERLAVAPRPFEFSRGELRYPYPTLDRHLAVSHDGSVAIYQEPNGRRIAPLSAIDASEDDYDGPVGTVIEFFPGRDDLLLCQAARGPCVAELDHDAGTADRRELWTDPPPGNLQANDIGLTPDGEIVYRIVGEARDDAGRHAVQRIVWMSPDGEQIGEAVIERRSTSRPGAQIVGHAG